jgi:uncharacterized membrane protein
MATTIGNPLSWGARALGLAGREVAAVAQGVGGQSAAEPVVRRIDTGDIRAALKDGLADFAAFRTDVAVMCLLYPVIGALLVYFALNQSAIHIVFPLMSGFALIGPVVAIGLYEMSKRRAEGHDVTWADAFGVLASPSIGAILALGLMLVVVFFVWLLVAWAIWALTLGPVPPVSAAAFLAEVFTTSRGWAMILIGVPAGFVFALVVLAVSVVSFPMMIDRPVGLPRAVVTSVEVARANPATVAIWGAIVAAALALGSLPLLLGLPIVLPILGHATWHLYRRAVTFR